MIESIIEFKHEKLKTEIEQIDGRLRFLIYACAGYLYNTYGKKLVLSELLRSQETQDEYYKNTLGYKENPWKSVHQYGRGADISVMYLTKEEYNDLLYFINRYIIYDGAKASATVHDVGQGIHFHVQVNYKGITEIKG